jgi:hypothetical protein
VSQALIPRRNLDEPRLPGRILVAILVFLAHMASSTRADHNPRGPRRG